MLPGEAIGLKLGKATRDAFGEALRDLGGERPEIVVVDADVGNSTKTDLFGKAFPERFFNVGIAESNLVSIAGGLASAGKIPVVASFAVFLFGNAFEQLRMSVAFPRRNVKVVGSHSGISIGEDGPSQMSVEDVALATVLPGFTVIVPADEVETREALRAAMALNGPVYLRLGRPAVPIVYEQGCSFTIGRANLLQDGRDITLIANGLMVAAALEAARTLAGRGISARVLDMATVKPLDEEAVVAAATETKGIVVAEEHSIHGGLGSAVAMAVARRRPTLMGFVGIRDTYAESGKPDELLQKYGLTASDIVNAATALLSRNGM